MNQVQSRFTMNADDFEIVEEKKIGKSIKFEAGLKPIIKHLSGQHDQSSHGNWASQGYSAEDAEAISRMSDKGPTIDELNDFLNAQSGQADYNDLVDFVNNDAGLYDQATEDIDFRVEERLARLQAEFPLHEYTEQEKMNIYEDVQRDMIQDFIANDDGTIAQMWADSNGSGVDESYLMNSFAGVYEMTHRGKNLAGEDVTLSSGIESLTPTSNDSFELTGNIYDGNSNWAGEWKRDFTRNPDGSWEVEHSFLKLEDEYQGTGFGKKFLADSEAWYISKGFSSIKVGTAWDGARHWARAGFDWNFKDMDANFSQLEDMRYKLRGIDGGKHLAEFDGLMDRMVKNYDGDFWSWDAPKPISDMPTPADFVTIGYKDKANNTWAGKEASWGLHMNYRKVLKEPDSRDMQTPIDRDGDGVVFDGTPRERMATGQEIKPKV